MEKKTKTSSLIEEQIIKNLRVFSERSKPELEQPETLSYYMGYIPTKESSSRTFPVVYISYQQYGYKKFGHGKGHNYFNHECVISDKRFNKKRLGDTPYTAQMGAAFHFAQSLPLHAITIVFNSKQTQRFLERAARPKEKYNASVYFHRELSKIFKETGLDKNHYAYVYDFQTESKEQLLHIHMVMAANLNENSFKLLSNEFIKKFGSLTIKKGINQFDNRDCYNAIGWLMYAKGKKIANKHFNRTIFNKPSQYENSGDQLVIASHTRKLAETYHHWLYSFVQKIKNAETTEECDEVLELVNRIGKEFEGLGELVNLQNEV